MKRLRADCVGIVQGSRVLFSDYENDGPMWSGEGTREIRYHVTFESCFREPPTVQVSLSMWDIDRDANHRVDISAENIARDSFDVVFRTWGDSRVARIRADWMVLGPLPHEDDWLVD